MNYASATSDKDDPSVTTMRQTTDGHKVYLKHAKRCRLDPHGEFGPYLIIVAGNQEEMEFRLLRSDDQVDLRTEFRRTMKEGCTLEALIDRLDEVYARIDE